MSGKTHLAMGVASALVIIRPMTLSDLIVCTGAAIIGSLICDIDIKTSNSRSAFNTILGIIVILSIIEGYINYRFNFSIMIMILEESNMYRLLSGIAVFIVTCIVCKEFPHRTFTHSALGVLLFSLIVFYIFPDMMMPFAVAMVSHIVLDMMNKKAVLVWYPLKRGASLGVCTASGKVNNILCIAGTFICVGYFYFYLIKK